MTRPLIGRYGKSFGKRRSTQHTSPSPPQDHLTRRSEVSPTQLVAATFGLGTIAKPLHLFSAPPPVWCIPLTSRKQKQVIIQRPVREKHNRRGSSGFGHKTYGSIKVTSGYSHSGFGQKICGSVKVLSGYSQPGLGQKTSGSVMVMSGYSQSGSGRKTYGSVKAFSGYSHPKVHAAPNDYHTEQRNILPLTFHHLSLHNQAQDCSEGNNCNVHKPTVLASPPLEMRESRARPASGRDSGNQLRNHPCPKSKRTYQIGLYRQKEVQKSRGHIKKKNSESN